MESPDLTDAFGLWSNAEKGGRSGISPRKPADHGHRPARFPHAKIWEQPQQPQRESNLVRLTRPWVLAVQGANYAKAIEMRTGMGSAHAPPPPRLFPRAAVGGGWGLMRRSTPGSNDSPSLAVSPSRRPLKPTPQVPQQFSRPSFLPVAPASAKESRSHVVSNGTPNHHPWRLSAMSLHSAGCQIAVTTVASNTYGAIKIEQVEARLVRKQNMLRLSTSATAFTCTLQSEAFVVSGQRNPTQWHAYHQSSPQQTASNRRRRQVHTRCSAPVSSQQCHPVLWSHCVIQYPLVAAYNPLPSTGHTHSSGKREINKKTRRPAASSSTIPTCENPGVTQPGIELVYPWWEASSLTAQPTRPPE
ncbi:hypothetical protein PR048_027734 [Dryococelus australis]|uniref:Uncharacterized protein n=1 Tax=Dryococelus australis TaxID=614101 RepID=A0ABQ9GHB2_9NEOP|nr:hypothetical protein PR048_027734 [Dryococelus australis]